MRRKIIDAGFLCCFLGGFGKKWGNSTAQTQLIVDASRVSLCPGVVSVAVTCLHACTPLFVFRFCVHCVKT